MNFEMLLIRLISIYIIVGVIITIVVLYNRIDSLKYDLVASYSYSINLFLLAIITKFVSCVLTSIFWIFIGDINYFIKKTEFNRIKF